MPTPSSSNNGDGDCDHDRECDRECECDRADNLPAVCVRRLSPPCGPVTPAKLQAVLCVVAVERLADLLPVKVTVFVLSFV
jgi:hypothetical protein